MIEMVEWDGMEWGNGRYVVDECKVATTTTTCLSQGRRSLTGSPGPCTCPNLDIIAFLES